MSGQPDFFAPLPSEETIGRRNGVAFSRESRERVGSFEKYRNAITALADKVGDLETYSGDGQIAGWFETHQRHLDYLDAKRIAFVDQLRSFADTPPEGPNSSSEVAPGIRRLPHPNTELLHDIRALLAQLVDGQTHTVVNHFSRIESTNEERAESTETAPAPDAPAVPVTPEVIEAVAEFLFDTGVDTPMIVNLRSIARCLRLDNADPIRVAAPTGVNTAPLVVYRTAALQDAISYRDDVFFRIRNLSAQPSTPFAHERLPELGKELHAAQIQVNRCTAELEQAREAETAETAPVEAETFVNHRRGSRFSHPIPQPAPETPDAAH